MNFSVSFLAIDEFHVGLEWTLHCLSHETVPVEASEPRVVDNIISIILRAKSCFWVFIEQFGDDILELLTHVNSMTLGIREYNRALLNQQTQFVMVLVHERRTTSRHFIN
jgi:hypothetical protein